MQQLLVAMAARVTQETLPVTRHRVAYSSSWHSLLVCSAEQCCPSLACPTQSSSSSLAALLVALTYGWSTLLLLLLVLAVSRCLCAHMCVVCIGCCVHVCG